MDIVADFDGADAGAGDRRRGIDRAIVLLEAMLRHRAPLKIGDLARLIGAPRSTTYELVNRLVQADMLEHVGSQGHVYFGRAMHLFGWAYGHHNAQHRRIAEALDRLAAETEATAQVCALRGNKYIVVDCRAGPGPFRITSDVGVEVPIPWTASGRLLLGHLTDEAIRAFVPPEDFSLPDGRTQTVEAFLADVHEARRRGYWEATALASKFTRCQAVPLRGADGTVAMTLCLVLPADTPEGRCGQVLGVLRRAAEDLSLGVV